MVQPTPSQERIRDHEGLDLLIVAPAGCGKTEALALRVAGLIARGEVEPPRRILVTTFSNRARDNARDRLKDYLTPQQMRDLVTVSNFHGLAARVVRAHANVIGLDPALIVPESDWVGAQCRARGLSFAVSADTQKRLRVAKQKRLDDAAVEHELVTGGSAVALAIERQRVAEGRLTYDDLPRLAELILANDDVAELYRSHFAAVVVDEFQDLTPQQLRIVNQFGLGKTTYAGDLAQGIYSFAGASPDEVYAALRTECSEVIELSESHRSAPAVLAMVNSLVGLTGGQRLKAAKPDSWPSGGLAGGLRFPDVEAEAEWIAKLCEYVLANAPNQRIGIVSRTKARRRYVDACLESTKLPRHRWEDGSLDTDTARVVKGMLARLTLAEFQRTDDQVGFLRRAVDLESVQDPDDRTALADALNWCYGLLRDGVEPAAVRSRVRVGDDSTLLNLPGVHLLTGHQGKGQQFDWIVVVGLEEGVIPDFRATTPAAIAEEARILSVMISRGRHGIVASCSETVPAQNGRIWPKEPSQFWSSLRAGNWLTGSEITAWLDAVDWDRVSLR